MWLHGLLALALVAGSFALAQLWGLTMDGSLFGYHPASAWTSMALFAPFGAFVIQEMRGETSMEGRRAMAQVHGIVQLLALVGVAIAFVAIYWNKNEAQKEHFTSWHGKLGLATCICMVLNSVGGIYNSVGHIFLRGGKRIKYLWVDRLHRICGVLALLFATATLILGAAYSKWALWKLDDTWRGIFSIIALVLPGGVALLSIRDILTT